MSGKRTIILLFFVFFAQIIFCSQGKCAGETDKFGRSSLHMASSRGDVEVVELLLRSGAKVNVSNRFGWTPLQLAASGGHAEVVEILLEAGADRKAKNKFGRTALDCAVRNEHTEVVRLLTGEQVREKVNEDELQTGQEPREEGLWN